MWWSYGIGCGLTSIFLACAVGDTADSFLGALAYMAFVSAVGAAIMWSIVSPQQRYGNTYEEHHHHYPRQRRADGVETVVRLPDGSVRTTRTVSRWE
jgi:hypothetical protein